MRAFILAGGKGSRTLDPSQPKVLTQITEMNLLDLQIYELASINEITEIILLLGHGSSKVISHVQKSLLDQSYLKPVSYIVEKESLGSAGSLRQILAQAPDEICFVAFGDIVPRGGIIESFHIWRSKGMTKENLLFVHPNNHPGDSDCVLRSFQDEVAEKIISNLETSYFEKPNLSPVGFFFLNSSDIDLWPKNKKIDLVRDVITSLIQSGKKIWAPSLLRRSIDIGTPERLINFKKTITKQTMYINFCIFIDRDDTLIYDPNPIKKSITDLVLIEGVVKFLEYANNIGIPVVCISNQPSVAKGQHSILEIESQNQQIQHLLTRNNVYIDRWVYCIHHPEIGFDSEILPLKIDCDCRKPKDGMIKIIKLQHSIDITKSVIVGDSFRDIEIVADLALRIHYFPKGTCGILKHHICVRNFQDAKSVLADYISGE